jgi:TonB-dependent SusC/RagA subfamily outer membrane receptor
MVYYLIVLRNKKFHQYNRFYLLGVAVVSWIIPLIKIVWDQQHAGVKQVDIINVVANGNTAVEALLASKQASFNWLSILPNIYVGVSLFLATAMVFALLRIYKMYKSYECNNLQQFYLVMTREKGTPFSFFSYIFWNAEIDIQTPAGKQILQHELTHVKQYHSIDKIGIQLILIVGWFNPFFWLLKKELDMIHEFIADKKSVENGDTASLAQMLLTTAYPGQQFPLTNPFFFSPIKRRLKMLTNVKNPSFSYARRIVVLPLLSIVVLLFAFRAKEEKMIAPVSLMDTTKKVMIVQGYKISPEDTLIASKEKSKSVVIRMDGAGASTNGQKPLFVLDGEVISESIMSVIDPTKIESVNILKDQAAVAIFGEKGKAGVVQITTKKGAAGEKLADGKIVIKGRALEEPRRLEEKRIIIMADSAKKGQQIAIIKSENEQALELKALNELDELEDYIEKLKGKAESLKGKTILLKSNNLKDVEFMSKNFDGAGIVVEELNGVKGNGKKSGITISGSSSGSTPGLILVDGEKKTKKELDAISPDQIKSVQVLKGESVIKEYGAEAKDGVIKITTKKKVNL